MELVAAYADWWNVHIGILDRFDEMRPRAGRGALLACRCRWPSSGRDRREEVDGPGARGASGMGTFSGTAPELVDYFGSLAERGVERVYVWFTDFAPPETMTAFGETVIGPLQAELAGQAVRPAALVSRWA